MSKLIKIIILVLVSIGLVGCKTVKTTQGGAIGIERKQKMISFVSAEKIEKEYAKSYNATIDKAKQDNELDKTSINAKRLDAIAARLIPHVKAFRQDALKWDWQVNLIKNEQLNANCGPGGKIIFYTGIIEQLNLTDDEIAAVMGHEMAHALREHGREGFSKAYGAQIAGQLATLLGAPKQAVDIAGTGVNYLMLLPNSRENENEADLIGLELMARAGYNPNAAVNLWRKMNSASGGKAPPEFMSTHPSSSNRITSLQKNIPKVMPFYNQAKMRR